MKTKIVIAFLFAISLSSMIVLSSFYIVTMYLSEPYLKIVGPCVHNSFEENKAMFHLVTQSSIFGALGGVLFTIQMLTSYIAQDHIPIVKKPEIKHYFIFAFLTPIKGLIAGLIASTIIGGTISFFGTDKTIGKAHLFIIGTALLAGYSEQFLQRIVDLANKKINQI